MTQRNTPGGATGGTPNETSTATQPTTSLSVPVLPDDADTLTAALKYAEAGWFTLPVRKGEYKNPGSRVGKEWQLQSSRDHAVITARYAGCDDGIALHTGRSGSMFFDVDAPEKFPAELWPLLEPAVFQSTRTNDTRRGHYGFATDRTFKNRSYEWGEVRSGNSVIIIEPSVHAKSAQGGQYHWVRTGPLPLLPDALAELIDEAVKVEPTIAATESGPVYAELPEPKRDDVDRYMKRTLAGIGDELRELLDWPKGKRNEYGIGWEKITSNAARRLGALYRAPWNTLTETAAWEVLLDNAPTDTSWTMTDLRKKWAAQKERSDPAEFPKDKDVQRNAEVDALAGEDAERAPTVAENVSHAPTQDDDGLPSGLDWADTFAGTSEEVDWLVPGLFARGRGYALVSEAKKGKSLLMLEIAARLANGLPVLGNDPVEPMNVLYVDSENTRQDIVGRLRDMGFGPHQLARLTYLSFPSMEPLNTAEGADKLIRLATKHHADLVIIDTLSRFIDGEEKDSGPYLDMYRLAMLPLKSLGCTTVRLDHFGKDPTKGGRGSSAKRDDVDAVWELYHDRNGLRLKCERQRSGDHADQIDMVRIKEPRLRHDALPDLATVEPTNIELSPVIAALDVCNVPVHGIGRDKAREMLQAGGFSFRNDRITEALRVRREAV